MKTTGLLRIEPSTDPTHPAGTWIWTTLTGRRYLARPPTQTPTQPSTHPVTGTTPVTPEDVHTQWITQLRLQQQEQARRHTTRQTRDGNDAEHPDPQPTDPRVGRNNDQPTIGDDPPPF